MLLEFIYSKYQDFLNAGDERVNNWPLVKSPFPVIGICLTYAFFVKVLGPRLMKNQKPFDLRILMIVYNFLMVIISTLLFVNIGIYGWFWKYNWKCQPVDYTKDGMPMAYLSYMYYLTKYIELLDTIFFILRKKFDNVSKLHVIHHGIMPLRFVLIKND